MKKLTKS